MTERTNSDDREQLKNLMEGLGGPFKEAAEDDLLTRIRQALKEFPVNQTRLWVLKPNDEDHFRLMAEIVSNAFGQKFLEENMVKTNQERHYLVTPEENGRVYFLESKGGHLSITPRQKSSTNGQS